MRYFFILAIAINFYSLSFSQEVSEQKNPWTNLSFNDSREMIRFLIVSDRTGGMRPGVFAEAIRKVDLLQPEFVMSIGDLIDGYTNDPKLVEKEWMEFEEIISGLKMPFFHVPGNHDISNPYLAREWTKRFGQRYYHFSYKNVLFLCLNTEDPPPHGISNEQVNYFKKVLTENENCRWIFVFMHQPFWQYGEKFGFDQIEEMLKGKPHTLFSGHTHNYYSAERHQMQYITMATTGGGSELRGAKFGEFDHVAWVTLTDDGPRIANLELKGISGADLVDEKSYAYVKPLREGNWFNPVPLMHESDVFDSLELTILFNNPASDILYAKGQLPVIPGVLFKPENIEMKIPAGQRSELKVSMKNLGVDYISALPEIQLKLDGRYDYKDGYELSATREIVLDWYRKCLPLKTPVKIDGQLDDWGTQFFEKVDRPGFLQEGWDWKGPDDGMFYLATAHDAEYLYIAFRSVDDKLIADPGKLAGHQDKIYLHLDPVEKDIAKGQSYLKGDESAMYIVFGPGLLPGDPVFATEAIPGSRSACLIASDGLHAEMAIPLNIFSQKKEWHNFRMNVGYMDHDNPSNLKPSVLWWKPLWTSKDNYPDSGVFIRVD